MTTKPEEKLYGSANFNSWKAKLTAILDENDLDDIVFNVIEEPTTNAGRLAYKRKQGKARRIIYDSVRESVMPNITSLKTAKECFDTLVNLYEKKGPSQKRVLKKRLQTLKMNKDESVGSLVTLRTMSSKSFSSRMVDNLAFQELKLAEP